MKKYFVIAFSILLTFNELIAQNEKKLDTLVFPNEITFHSSLEEEAFREYFNNKHDSYLKLFFAKDKDLTKEDFLIKQKYLLTYIDDLKNNSNYSKPNKKKVKYYFNEIHDKYLVKYDLNTFFPQIFKNGYYNCVTGTILFSTIFDELNIPYIIKVSPIHAYLVAYPNTESILVETTNPVKGYFVFNQTFKENYIKHLKDSKLISIQEYNSATIDELFEKHYFNEKNITLKEMVGIQYYNDAVEKIQNQKFEEAFYELEKAYLFYPSEEIGYLLFYSAAIVIEKHDFSDLKYVDLLYKIARYDNYGITREQIVGEFSRITQNQLEYKGRYDLYDSIYNRLYSKLTDIETRKEIAFIYNYEKARLFVRNNKTDEALTYIVNAYTLRPDHLDVQTLLIHCISNKFGNKRISEKILKEFLDFTDLYPAIKTHNIYLIMLSEAYIQLAVDGYEQNDINRAIKYQNLFLENSTKDSYSAYETNISILFSTASVYYFKKGNMQKSKSLIIEGLKLVPESYELKQRLKAFN